MPAAIIRSIGADRCVATIGLAAAMGIACNADSAVAGLSIPDNPGDAAIAIVDARVLTMESAALEEGWTVVVESGRILAAGPAAGVAVPPDAIVVRANGHVLMPGLADMHVHVRRSDLRSYVQHGVTTVRNMWGFTDLAFFTQRDGRALIPDSVAAPTIYSASPGVDRAPEKWPQTRLITRSADAAAIVEALKVEGWEAIKLYSGLTASDYDSLVAATRRQGMDAVGHVPFSITIDHALAAGQRSVEHLGGYDRAFAGRAGATAWASADPAAMPDLARLTAASGTWNCPTTVVHEALLRSASATTRSRAGEGRRAAIRAFHEAGARLLAGTDAGIGLTEPGSSLVEELKAFVASGLSRYGAIRTATVDAAEFLREPSEFGVVRAGARADLLLVAGNPLEDLRRLTSPSAVMVRGRWVHVAP